MRTPLGFTGPNAKALKAWVAKNMPELDRDLGPMNRMQVLARLNALTGAGVSGSETMEGGCAKFLRKLQEITGEP